jgi:indole-3-pyruvate monooxygenase
VPATVLEMSDSLAPTWRHRTYDRLTLHLPRRFCELPLLPFPEDFPTYPSKDQFVAYMEAYAAAAWVMRLAGGGENVLMARWLVVAAGENAGARLPRRAAVCGKRNAHVRVQVRGGVRGGGKVLVVGCGMEVSLDLCRHGAKPSLVVRNTVNTSIASFVPFCSPLMLTTTYYLFRCDLLQSFSGHASSICMVISGHAKHN